LRLIDVHVLNTDITSSETADKLLHLCNTNRQDGTKLTWDAMMKNVAVLMSRYPIIHDDCDEEYEDNKKAWNARTGN